MRLVKTSRSKELRKIFNEIEEISENFTKWEPSILDDARRICVYRILTGIKQIHFAKMINVSRGAVRRWEEALGNVSSYNKIKIIKFLENVFKKKSIKPSFELFWKNKKKLFTNTGAIDSLKRYRGTGRSIIFPITRQEREMYDLLKENKIEFKLHYAINGFIEVDFFIKTKTIPVILECKKFDARPLSLNNLQKDILANFMLNEGRFAIIKSILPCYTIFFHKINPKRKDVKSYFEKCVKRLYFTDYVCITKEEVIERINDIFKNRKLKMIKVQRDVV